jgi:hypothetical protein
MGVRANRSWKRLLRIGARKFERRDSRCTFAKRYEILLFHLIASLKARADLARYYADVRRHEVI